MPKTTTAKTAVQETALVSLAERANFITQIRTDIKSVPNENLVEFYFQGDVVAKQLAELKTISRDELIARRAQGEPVGDSGSYSISSGDRGVTIQCRNADKMDLAKVEALLASKKLLAEGSDFVLTSTSNAEAFQKFLKKNRAALVEFGLQAEHVINETKVQALAALGKITVRELEACIEHKPPTFAVVLNKPKKV